MNRSYANEFLDELSPEGQRARQVLTPSQQFRVSGSTTPPPSAGVTSISDPVAALEGLDPADDGYLDKQAMIFQSAPDLLRIPNVQQKVREGAALHAEAQQYFKQDPTLVDFYISQRGGNVAPGVAIGELRKRAQDNALKGAFLKSGGLVEEYEKLRDPSTGQVDRFSALDYLNKAERASKVKAAIAPKPLSAEGMNRILSAEDALEAASRTVDLSDENKKSVFKKEFKRLPSSQEDWDRAYELANKDVRNAQEKLESLKKSYSTQYQMPPELQVESVTTETLPDQFQTGTVTAPQKESAASFLERNKRKL